MKGDTMKNIAIILTAILLILVTPVMAGTLEDFLVDNWGWMGAALTALVTFFIPGTRSAWNVIFRTVVGALLTKKALIKVVMYFGDKLVNSTKTNLDNAVWIDVREALIKELNGG